MPEEATYMGGCSYYISATDGEILMEGDITLCKRGILLEKPNLYSPLKIFATHSS